MLAYSLILTVRCFWFCQPDAADRSCSCYRDPTGHVPRRRNLVIETDIGTIYVWNTVWPFHPNVAQMSDNERWCEKSKRSTDFFTPKMTPSRSRPLPWTTGPVNQLQSKDPDPAASTHAVLTAIGRATCGYLLWRADWYSTCPLENASSGLWSECPISLSETSSCREACAFWSPHTSEPSRRTCHWFWLASSCVRLGHEVHRGLWWLNSSQSLCGGWLHGSEAILLQGVSTPLCEWRRVQAPGA